MDSLAQNLLWLAWETSLDADPNPEPLAAMPTGKGLQVSYALGFAAGTIVLGSSLGSPAWANSHRGGTVYVNTPQGYALNVRWGPGTNTGVHRKVRRGTPLQVTGVRRNGWVQLDDATWVAGNLISVSPVGGGQMGDDRNLATVITPQDLALNIRSGPGFNHPVVGQYVNGSRIALTGRFNVGWAQLANGNWVDSTHLQYSGPIRNDPPPTTTQSNNPAPTNDILELQRLLRQTGFLPPNSIANGIYDETTQTAVREFQRVNGLPITGTVDAATWQALYRATASNPQSSPRPTAQPSPQPTPQTSPQPTPQPSPNPSPSPSPNPTNPPPGASNQMRVVTDGDSTSVYDGPGTEFGFVRSVPNGSIVNVTGRTTGNWSELSDGGWIFSLWLDAP